MKKVISMLLSVVMLLTVTAGLDLTAYAETYSGTCGENITWTLDTSTGVLTLDGSGDMTDYFAEVSCIDNFDVMAPWYANGCLDYVKTVNISDGITSIGDGAFWNCTNLTSITIPDSVTEIGKGAFYCCVSLSSITIPDNIESIRENTFSYCKSLTSIAIPNSVKSIGVNAFYGCSGLTSITIPNNVKRIGAYAFESCSSLVSITISNSVKSIGDYAFESCLSLTSITIPNSVTKIGRNAFYDCSNLTSIVIPKSVTKIGEGAFYGCQKLSNVYYGSSKKNWNKITVKGENSYLTGAKIYYNSYPNSTSVKKITKKSGAFKVKWTGKSNVTGYEIQYSTDQSFSKNKKSVTIKKSSTTSKTIKDLKSDKTYYVRVRTYKTVNGKKVYSNWSTAKKVKI